jgi:hypothetical protein
MIYSIFGINILHHPQEGQRDVETGEVGLNGPASGRKDPTTPPAATPPPAGPKQILHDISGHVKPGM